MNEAKALNPDWWKNPDLWRNAGDGSSSVEAAAFANILDECLHLIPPEPVGLPLALPLTRIEAPPRRLPPSPRVEQWVIVRGDGVSHVCDIRDLPVDCPDKPRRKRSRGRLFVNGMPVERMHRAN